MEEIQLNSFPTTKSLQAAMAGDFVNKIIDGEFNPIEVAARLKGISEVATAALKDDRLKEAVLTECEKYDKKERPSYQGVTIQVKETGTKYDYSVCNDAVYNGMVEQMEALKAEMKAREKFLCGIGKTTTIVDDTTGEICEIHPPHKSSTTSFAITFPK